MEVTYFRPLEVNSKIPKLTLNVYCVGMLKKQLSIIFCYVKRWEKFRNPILTKISETYLNLTGKEYGILDTRSKLQIIIDCSVLLSQESILNKRLKIQDLSSLEFHARRLTHVLHTNRYRLLNHPDQIE